MQSSNIEFSWLLHLQLLQSRHDALYCSDVVRMSPTHRVHHLVTQMAKFVFNIQRDAYTRYAADTVGKRVTDLIITSMSLLTALNVDMGELLKKLNNQCSDEASLMQWLKENYVYALSDEISMKANQVYDKRIEYTVALPIHMHQMVETACTVIAMNREMNPKAVLTNAVMHVWIQCIISHAQNGHRSFTEAVKERLNQVEMKNIHHNSYGLYPNYNAMKQWS